MTKNIGVWMGTGLVVEICQTYIRNLLFIQKSNIRSQKKKRQGIQISYILSISKNILKYL